MATHKVFRKQLLMELMTATEGINVSGNGLTVTSGSLVVSDGLMLGSGTEATKLLTGSVSVTAPSSACVGGTSQVYVDITSLVATDRLFLTRAGTTGSALEEVMLLSAQSGAGSALFTFVNTGSADAGSAAIQFNYLAVAGG